MSRILGQAETWYEEFGDLVSRCGIAASMPPPSRDASISLATLEEIKAAVESAESNISLDLDEARALRTLGERIQKWQDRVVMAAPKRSKRVGKGKRQETRYTAADLISLIDESSTLPINTEEDAGRLRQQLFKANEWRLQARRELGDIATSFRTLRQAVNSDYGFPNEFYGENNRGNESTEITNDAEDANPVSTEVVEENKDLQPVAQAAEESLERQPVNDSSSAMQTDECAHSAPETAEDSSQADMSSIADSELGATSDVAGGANVMYKMISSLLKSSKLTGIRTPEEEVTELLEKVVKWIIRSLKCIDSPKDVYERKSFDPFDDFVAAGKGLLVCRDSLQELELDDKELLSSLGSSCVDLMSDQLVRLKILQAHRDQFIAWFKNAQQVLSSKENRVTLDVLKQLAEQSREYPAFSDVVQKVRQVAQRANKWKEAAAALLDSDEKPMMKEAKEMLEEGDKLNLICDELKMLRNAVRSGRAWATRVKRCKIDQGGSNSASVTKLLNEHESLLLSMPDEVSKLNQALRGYCLCRQPYDGFMIGCDGCGEWYHGPCVGVTESRAEKSDKFLCVRCCLKRTFKSSALVIASIIRKFTDPKELRKVRHHEAQKHQRKVRKEKRDIENLATETESLATLLNGLGAEDFQDPTSEADGHDVNVEGVAVSPSSRDSESNYEVASGRADGQPKKVESHADEQVKQLKTESNGMSSSPEMNVKGDPVPTEAFSFQKNEDPLLKRKQGMFFVFHYHAWHLEPFLTSLVSPCPQKSKLS